MPAALCYTAPATVTAVVGFGDPSTTRRKPQPHVLRLSSLCPQFRRLDGRLARACRLNAPRGPGSPTRRAAALCLATEAAVYQTDHLEHIMGKLSRRATPRLAVINGQPTITSRQVAEYFGKRHDHVMRAIRSLIEQLPESARPNFGEATFDNETNGQKHPMYTVTKDGFALLGMGFTGREALLFKVRLLERFNAMAEKLAHKQNRTLALAKSTRGAINTVAPAAPLALPDHSAAAIGRGLPPLPEGLAIPPEIAAQIEAAAIPLAMRCLPALRSYLERRVAQQARNAHGWLPDRVAASLASASLAQALNHEAHTGLQECINTAAALQIISSQALERMRLAQEGGKA